MEKNEDSQDIMSPDELDNNTNDVKSNTIKDNKPAPFEIQNRISVPPSPIRTSSLPIKKTSNEETRKVSTKMANLSKSLSHSPMRRTNKRSEKMKKFFMEILFFCFLEKGRRRVVVVHFIL